MTNETTEIHGHDILNLVHTAEVPFTRATLLAHVRNQYGPEARFCTCHGGGMTFEALLEFLLSRGKIVEHDGKLYTDISKVCSGGQHDHHHDHD